MPSNVRRSSGLRVLPYYSFCVKVRCVPVLHNKIFPTTVVLKRVRPESACRLCESMNECSPLGRRLSLFESPGFAPVLAGLEYKWSLLYCRTAAAARALGGCSLVWVTALSDFDRRLFDSLPCLCLFGRLDDL